MRIPDTLAAAAALAAFCSAQCSLSTLFAANNGGNVGGGFYFDLTVNSPSGVTIVALDTNFGSAAGTIGFLDVYTIPTTFAGNLGSPGAWTLVGSASVTSTGRNNPTRATYNPPIVLPQGTMGIALHANGLSHAYTNGNGSNQTYTNADLILQSGSAQNTFLTGGIFNPRVWNGVIHYLGSCASATAYGTGCGGTPLPTFYETFGTANANDLSGSGIAMIWTGSFYIVVPGSPSIVAPSSPPTPFNNDETRRVPLPWSFPTQRGSTSDVWVCSNGFVALEPTSITDPTESFGELLSGPMRLCPYWDDLDPGSTGGGTVHLEQDPANGGLFHITWIGVPESGGAGANDFQLTLHDSGIVEFRWGAMSAVDGLVGYSPGSGAADPGGSDVSMLSTLILHSGIPNMSMVPVSRPVIGTTAATRTENIPPTSTAGFLVYGLQRLDPGIPLPILGPGCLQQVTPDVAVFFLPAAATHMHSAMIPNNPALAGLVLNQQSAVFDPALGTLLAANAIEWVAEVR